MARGGRPRKINVRRLASGAIAPTKRIVKPTPERMRHGALVTHLIADPSGRPAEIHRATHSLGNLTHRQEGALDQLALLVERAAAASARVADLSSETRAAGGTGLRLPETATGRAAGAALIDLDRWKGIVGPAAWQALLAGFQGAPITQDQRRRAVDALDAIARREAA